MTSTPLAPPAVDVRRAADRFHTQLEWLDSWHSFSFGGHSDPDNVHHGLLLVNNDDRIRGGTGFPTHPHRDSTGAVGDIYPGLAQRMSAGTGVTHSEYNASATADLHLVQMWVLPDTRGIEPSYEQRDVSDALASGGLVPVASGRGHEGAVTIHQRDAVLWAGRLTPGSVVTVPDAAHVHVFVAVGTASLDGAGDLATGDAVRLTAAGERALTAGPEGAEVLIWEMH